MRAKAPSWNDYIRARKARVKSLSRRHGIDMRQRLDAIYGAGWTNRLYTESALDFTGQRIEVRSTLNFFR
jgi:hypothetical protein